MNCHRCQGDPQPEHFASPRKCAFDDAGNFTPDNWNCATITALEDAFAFQYKHYDGLVWGHDETLEVLIGKDYGGFIVITRYKQRGKASSAIMVGDFWPPETLTLDIANKWLDGSYWRES